MSDKTFSVREFEEFCRGKGDARYDGCDGRVCALAQFGFPNVIEHNRKRHGISMDVYDAAVVYRPFTFSALADRLAKIPA